MSRGKNPPTVKTLLWEMALLDEGPEGWEEHKSRGLCHERMSKRWAGARSQRTEGTMMKNLDFSLCVIKTPKKQKENTGGSSNTRLKI